MVILNLETQASPSEAERVTVLRGPLSWLLTLQSVREELVINSAEDDINFLTSANSLSVSVPPQWLISVPSYHAVDSEH